MSNQARFVWQPGDIRFEDEFASLVSQLTDLAFNPAELRDPHGRWTRGGAPGPFNPAVLHLYHLLPQVDQATKLGLYDEPQVHHIQAEVHIVTLPGGEKVIDKRGENPTDLDREELSSYLAQAIGAPAPAIYRAAPDRILEEYVPGKTILRYLSDVVNTAREEAKTRTNAPALVNDAGIQASDAAENAIYATPEAQAIADLDYLTTNDDRNWGNLIISPDHKPVAIDHGVVMFDGMPSDSPFVTHSDPMMRGFPGTASPDDPAAVAFRQQRAVRGGQLADQLHQVRPQFERTGHLDWFDNMIQTPVAQLINPADTRQAEQLILQHWHDKYGDPLP